MIRACPLKPLLSKNCAHFYFVISGASIPGGAVLCTGDFRADNRLLSRFDTDPAFKKLADVSFFVLNNSCSSEVIIQ